MLYPSTKKHLTGVRMALTAAQVRAAKPKASRYELSDGRRLYLRVGTTGAKTWYYNYTFDGKRTKKQLGSADSMTLAEARKEAARLNSLLEAGSNPFEAKANDLGESLETIAYKWLEIKASKVTARQVVDIRRSLELHIFPAIGKRAIADIAPLDVIKLMEPLEQKGNFETIRRLCSRLSQIADFAVARGTLQINPFTRLTTQFAAPTVENLPSVQPEQLPMVLARIRNTRLAAITTLALRLQLHTLTRPGELTGAQWCEVDFEAGTWSIPPERMKARKLHIVPLTDTTSRLFEKIYQITGSGKFVFPHASDPTKSMNSQSPNAALKRAGLKGILVSHGFRSIGSTALNQSGKVRADVVEKLLAHRGDDEIRNAYNRAEYLMERKEALAYWDKFIHEAEIASLDYE